MPCYCSWHLPSTRGDRTPVEYVSEGDGCLGLSLTTGPASSVLTSVPNGLRDPGGAVGSWGGTVSLALVFRECLSLTGGSQQRRLLGGGGMRDKP